MPAAPNVDGWPLWAQIPFLMAFGLLSLWLGYKGYAARPSQRDQERHTGESAQILGASIADMGAIRQLSTSCAILADRIESLEGAVREQTHWVRNAFEQERELCQRLRELREEMARNR